MKLFKSPLVIICLMMMPLLSFAASENDTPKSNSVSMDFKENQVDFLSKFGYMGERSPDEEIRELSKANPDEALKKAVRMYQKFYGLEITGEVNEETMAEMQKPRCGTPDLTKINDIHELQSNSSTGRSKRYAILPGGGWRKTKLTYRLAKNMQKRLASRSIEVTRHHVAQILDEAFEEWAKLAPLTFTGTTDFPDIDIRFETRSHGDGDAFDGPGSTLAHTFYPYYGGDIHFDEEEPWTKNSRYGVNLFWVAAHEIGHALGLGHTSVQSAVMFPEYKGQSEDDFEFSYDDINGIQAIYGKRAVTSSTTTTSTTTARTTTAVPSTQSSSKPITSTPSSTPTQPSTSTPSSTSTQPSTTPSSTEPTTTVQPVVSEDGSNFCQLSSIDAAYMDRFGRAFFFKGDYVGLVTDALLPGFPKLITELFPKLPSHLDAVLDLPSLQSVRCFWRRGRRYCYVSQLLETARTYFFKGDTYYKYEAGSFSGSGNIASAFPGVPTPIDAATTVDGRYLYFMKGTQMWEMQRLNRRLLGGTTRISSFTGLPSTLDAVLVSGNGPHIVNFFFKGDQYYRITSGRSSVDHTNPPYPRPINTWWFDCPSNVVGLRAASSGHADSEEIGLNHTATAVFVDQDGELITDFELVSDEDGELMMMTDNGGNTSFQTYHWGTAIFVLMAAIFTQ